MVAINVRTTLTLATGFAIIIGIALSLYMGLRPGLLDMAAPSFISPTDRPLFQMSNQTAHGIKLVDRSDPIFRRLTSVLHPQLIGIGRNFSNDTEDHSGTFPFQTRFYFSFAAALPPAPPSRRFTICEIGTNLGHSASTLLTALPTSKYIGFDLGHHPYIPHILAHLKSTFGDDRLELTLGDSYFTVPEYFAKNPSTRCDLINVDGGHNGDTPCTDLRNMRRLAAARDDANGGKGAVLLLDDTECRKKEYWCVGPTDTWHMGIAAGWVRKVACEQHPTSELRGFCLGWLDSVAEANRASVVRKCRGNMRNNETMGIWNELDGTDNGNDKYYD